jgi:metallo-beta-lactamase family protein
MTTTNKNIYQIFHLGGEKTVTGSCHILSIKKGPNIMIDCGLPQGNDKAIPFEKSQIKVKDIDFLFITHAHLDHIGRIPELIEKGFKGEIICTHPTKKIMVPMLKDAMGFSEKTSNQISKLEQTINDISWGFEYNEYFSLKNGVKFKLSNAGHILGSCFIKFEIPHTKNKKISIIFSGDLGNKCTPLLPDPDKPDNCDLLILESTYGNRVHEQREQRIENLGQILTKALKDKGKVFVPAFSLGRTQEFIYELDRLFSDKTLQDKFPELTHKIPVFIDSPLGLEITKIYSSLNEFFDKEAKNLLNSGDNPLDFKGLYCVDNFESHKKLTMIKGPAIIIAGSGMCNGGRILNHLEFNLDKKENDIFFIGYQANGTPGNDIIKYSKHPNGYVKINNHKIFIKAKVHNLSGYSAHADKTFLVEWVKSMEIKPKTVKLVHGDNSARNELSNTFKKIGYKIIN